ncbi:hypothetical protein Patl1_25115 [Pistacia atlantica]|uniref:Uncharacterized protein n=1 Tax=Pistacia atlantica TaxID=434234 RepID=A0ACC1B032_9ROSI|nr:hypothetical protein Patl1_25115 [Pistacia atlantica]
MLKSVATIAGGAAGAFALMAIFVGLLWFCKSQCKNVLNKNSETGSSDPSALVEWNRGAGPSSATEPASIWTPWSKGISQWQSWSKPPGNLVKVVSLAMEASVQYTRACFAILSLLSKGALVNYLSEIRHRNLVTLLGYCQENGSQILVFEYLPNGNMCNHLYDTGRESSTKLEFKQRVSIALGAAKGLCHLHSLRPSLLHKNFKTANVLVDENFIAKVADVGISTLLEKLEETGPSHMTNVNVFRDPE